MDANAIIERYEAEAKRLYSVLLNLIKLNKINHRPSAIPSAVAVDHEQTEQVVDLLEKLDYTQFRKNSLNAKEFTKNGYSLISVGYDLVRVGKGTKERTEVPHQTIQQFQQLLADFNAEKRAVDKSTIEFHSDDAKAVYDLLKANFKRLDQNLFEQDDCYYTVIDNSVYLRTRPHIEIGSSLDLDF